MRHMFSEVHWTDKLDGRGVNVGWMHLKNIIKDRVEESIVFKEMTGGHVTE